MEQKMKVLALSFPLAALITSASAQTFSLSPTVPRTVPIPDASGKTIGTATISDDDTRMVIRDLKGDLVGTAIVNADGTQTFYDINGRQVDGLVGLKYLRLDTAMRGCLYG
jgi:hypothetical protein